MSTKEDAKKFKDAEQAAKPLVADDVVAMAEAAKKSGLTDDKAAAWAAWESLGTKERQLTGKQVAAALGMTKAELAGKIEKGDADDAEAVQLIKAHDLSPDPVDGAELLDDIVSVLRRFLFLPPHAAEAIALWVVHTHGQAIEAFDFAPYLNLWSPLKRCGKSRLVGFLRRLCARPFAVSGITTAALFRTIHGHRPTVLLDEADKIFAKPKDNAELIGAINAGNERGAVIPRCEGDDHKVKAFNCFAPYMIAGIGSPPDTIEDRAIRIAMQRKPKTMKLERRTRGTYSEVWKLGERAARWAADNLERLRSAGEAEVDIEVLDDRACDIWGPLLAVANAASGDWPAKAKAAAIALSGGRDLNDDSAKGRILRDIKVAFDTDDDGNPLAAPHKALATEDIFGRLNRDKESPWPGWNNGKGLNDRGVAGLLKLYGIRPKKVTALSGVRLQGYERTAFLGAWASYADPDGGDTPEPEPGNAPGTHEATPPPYSRTNSQIAKNTGNPASERGSAEDAAGRSFSGNLGPLTTCPAEQGIRRPVVYSAPSEASKPTRDAAQATFDLPEATPNLDAFKAELAKVAETP